MHTYRLLAHAALACLTFVANLTAQEPKPLEIPVDPMAALAAMPIADPIADGRVITVIDGATKKPIAGANVLLFPPLTEELRKTSQRMRLQLGENASNKIKQLTFGVLFAKRFVTDANGVAKVPNVEPAFAFVVYQDMSAMWNSGLSAPVTLQPTRYVKVKVTDCRGKPARGVTVGLCYQDSHFYARARATTDKTGTCRIERNKRIQRDKLRVVAMIATDEPVQLDFLASESTDEPLALQLPPCGQVRFILYGEDERPAKLLERATLVIKPNDMMHRPPMRVAPARFEADGALFAHVGLGLRVEVQANINGIRESINFASKGPTREHELIVVEGRLNVGPPILRLRVLDQQGQPLANQDVGTLKRSKQYFDHITDTTDADGYLNIPVSNRKPDRIYILLREESEGTVYRGAAHIECANLKPGKQDFGDVQLEEEPVIAKGQLLDPNKQPVPGVWLRGRTTIASNGSGGGSSSGKRWYFTHRVRTDKDGRFELRELHPLDHSIQLSIQGKEWAHADGTLEVTPDGSEQTFAVSRAGTLSGTCAEPLEGMLLEVTATRRGSNRKHMGQIADGKFSIINLPAGTYDVEIGKQGGLVVKGVELPKPGEPQDARLQNIKWREHFQVIETKVTDDEGKPLQRVLVWCLVKQEGGGWSGSGARTNEDGIARQLAPKKDLQIKVEPEGYLKQVFTEDVTNLHVKLKAIAPIKVHIVGLPKLPDGIFANVSVESVQARFFRRGQGGRLKKGRCTVQPDNLGKCELQLSLAVSYTNGWPNNVRKQLARIAQSGHVSYEAEATSKPAAEKQFTLEEEDLALLNEILDEIKEVLKQHNKK